jgi:hypothetical protein
MNKIQKVSVIIGMAVLLSMTNQNQLYAGPLEDAKTQIEKEEYNKQVEQAKRLMKEKKDLENRIKEIDSKLDKISKDEFLPENLYERNSEITILPYIPMGSYIIETN